MKKLNILVTGYTGFIGKAIGKQLSLKGHSVRALVRPKINQIILNTKEDHISIFFGDILNRDEVYNVLDNIDCIVHCAGSAYSQDVRHNCCDNDHYEINLHGTQILAEEAIRRGVKKFIFLSTIKVNGERTVGENKFHSDSECSPVGKYAMSKYNAERALIELAKLHPVEFVIVRFPLVYGPGVKGNFLLLQKIISKGVPLPFSGIRNQRSFISLTNLVDFVSRCVLFDAFNQYRENIFLISDCIDVSTPSLVKKIAEAYNIKSKLFYFPVPLLKLIFIIIGKSNLIDQLIASLQVEPIKSRSNLTWVPVNTMEDELFLIVQSEKFIKADNPSPLDPISS